MTRAAVQSRPWRPATYTASARRETLSLRTMLLMWNFAVVAEMNSAAPIS